MKKLSKNVMRLVAAGAAASALFAIPGCGLYGPPPENFDAAENVAVAVYGPPEAYESEEITEENHSEEAISEELSVEEYSPKKNIEADVYGPPEWFE